ncbi:MAG: hypothetical protein JWM92_117 [Candidatus Nomurabacteria bacterium]|jgi:hypothetical protein|nr:hypothetical protein [Candidatus Nomurabacteria bacterium]
METQTAVAQKRQSTSSADHESIRVNSPMTTSLSLLRNRNKALVLGDVSLIQSKYLLESANFSNVTVVDANQALFDEEVIPISDDRLERVQMEFQHYEFPLSLFDFIYGKTIANTPKDIAQTIMSKIERSLTFHGIFCAVWASKGDTFRPIHYSKPQLVHLYEENGFKIIALRELPLQPVKGGKTNYGVRHEIVVIATKQ